MPPLVDYFILRSQTDGPFALNGTGSRYTFFSKQERLKLRGKPKFVCEFKP